MTDYTELVKALRIHASVDIECYECAYYDDCCINGNGHTKMMTDAADAIEELMKNLDMASQELSWTISYAMHLMRDIDELHDMVNEVYYDEL